MRLITTRWQRAWRLARWLGQVESREQWRLPPYRGYFGLVRQLGLLAGLIFLALHPELGAPIRRIPLLLGGLLAMRLLINVLGGAQLTRSRLFAAPLLPLVHMAPLPPGQWLVAELWQRVRQGVVGSLWTALSLTLLAPGGWSSRLLLWLPLTCVCSMLVGAIGLLLGSLSMVVWIERWPRAVGPSVYVLGVLQSVAGGWVVWAAAQGRDAGLLYKAALALPLPLLTLPGLWLALRWLLGRERLGWRYHRAWLVLREQAGQDGPQRSRRLWALPGASGVLLRDWLSLVRNPIGRLRIILAVAVVLLAPVGGRLLRGTDGKVLVGAAAIVWFALWLEWLGAAFTGEGPAVQWYRLAPFTPLRLLWGKWLALALPSAGSVGLAAGLAAWAAAWPASLALRALLGSLGAGTVMLGLAATTPGPASTGFGRQDLVSSWLGEQIPRSPGAIAGMALAAIYLALLVWGHGALNVVLLVALPPAALLVGAWRLRRTWRIYPDPTGQIVSQSPLPARPPDGASAGAGR